MTNSQSSLAAAATSRATAGWWAAQAIGIQVQEARDMLQAAGGKCSSEFKPELYSDGFSLKTGFCSEQITRSHACSLETANFPGGRLRRVRSGGRRSEPREWSRFRAQYEVHLASSYSRHPN